MKEILKKGKKAIVIVAHPDDETIWMGGVIKKHQNIDWTIFSLCRASDPDRAPKFRKVCLYFGAKSIISDLDDEHEIILESYKKEAKKIIFDFVGKKKYDYIFTHGENGEYGHEAHVAAHFAVQELAEQKLLKPEKVFYFNYKRKINKKDCFEITEKSDTDYKMKLSEKEFFQKKSVMTKIYGFDQDGIDANLCTKIESFKIKQLDS